MKANLSSKLIFLSKNNVCVHSIVSDSLQPIDYTPPSSSVHGIFQARILEWIAISYSKSTHGNI